MITSRASLSSGSYPPRCGAIPSAATSTSRHHRSASRTTQPDRPGPTARCDPHRSKKAFRTWLVQHDQTWRKQVEVVAMAGFTEFKSAAGEEPSKARAIMVPFHVVALAGDRSTSAATQVAWGAYQRLIQAYYVMARVVGEGT